MEGSALEPFARKDSRVERMGDRHRMPLHMHTKYPLGFRSGVVHPCSHASAHVPTPPPQVWRELHWHSARGEWRAYIPSALVTGGSPA